MTIRNLDHLFNPRAIALIGASAAPGSVGAVLAANLFRSGFDGPIMPVHPKHAHIHSVPTYADIASLPVMPDLCVIATPPDTVPGIVEDLATRGAKAAVVITAGFGEGGREHGQKLRQQMLDAARSKPVIVVKTGQHPAGARAAASHTRAMAGSDMVYDTAIRRAGMLRVFSLEELFDAVTTLGSGVVPKDDRIAIVANGGGIGVLATDAVVDGGGRLAEFSTETLGKLDAVLPPTWSRGNPVDIVGDADGARYAAAMKAVCEDPNTDAVLVLNCPTAVASQTEAAEAVAGVAGKRQRVTVLTSGLGNHQAEAARRVFAEKGIPTCETPTQAVGAFLHLIN